MLEALLTSYTFDRSDVKEKKRGSDYMSYPAIMISHEAANLYCDWLTDMYNQTPKRKYQKVKFRLPTQEEFQVAATGIYNRTKTLNKDDITKKAKDKKTYSLKDYPNYNMSYPWWYYFFPKEVEPKNELGCYLGNFRVDQKSCANGILGDGFAFMSPVASYFANDVGLYDVVGNVGEMVQQKGVACGGSWSHAPEKSTTSSTFTYDGPDTRVGFRIYMEIIEN